jgi:hypothetical protein
MLDAFERLDGTDIIINSIFCCHNKPPKSCLS